MSKELHPSPTARTGFLDYTPNTVLEGAVKLPESGFTHCRQCGFVPNTARDAHNIGGVGNSDGNFVNNTSMLTDGGLENWTGNVTDSWTISGSTVTKETARGFYRHYLDSPVSGLPGSASAKLVRAGSTITISQSVSSPSNANGQKLWLRAYVKCETNNVIRLRLTINSVDTYSAYNINQVNFRELSLRLTAPSSITSMTAAILADSEDGTAYVDDLILQRGESYPTETVAAGCPQCGSYFYI